MCAAIPQVQNLDRLKRPPRRLHSLRLSRRGPQQSRSSEPERAVQIRDWIAASSSPMSVAITPDAIVIVAAAEAGSRRGIFGAIAIARLRYGGGNPKCGTFDKEERTACKSIFARCSWRSR